ncbi:glycosyltransferase family 4 protein [Alcaligenaceae bacterium CGII-47]|nr:glycosyltransferase family 4 protein [Alcaligenaceae bacterium CGII-47]
MTALRILHSEAATGFGGQEQYIFRMMCAMRECGHHMEAACQPHAQLTARLRDEGFVVHTLYMDGPLNYIRGVSRLTKVLKQGRFDVVNTHSRRDALLVGMAARFAGVPLIVRTRHLAKKIGSLLSFTIVPKRVITASDFVRNLLIARGVSPAHVATVYPAVDFPDPMPAPILRTSLGLSDRALIVGSVGVLRAEKGHAELIEAMAPIIGRCPDTHLVIVGGGHPAQETLQALVDKKGLTRNVHLLGTRNDVPALLPDFDVFALATHSEASGTAFVEAGAVGIPVIGTRVGGVPEMMRDGETGLLVPLFDIPALSAAIEQLLKAPDLRRQMGRAGRQYCFVEDRFTRRAMARNTEACYQRWLEVLR